MCEAKSEVYSHCPPSSGLPEPVTLVHKLGSQLMKGHREQPYRSANHLLYPRGQVTVDAGGHDGDERLELCLVLPKDDCALVCQGLLLQLYQPVDLQNNRSSLRVAGELCTNSISSGMCSPRTIARSSTCPQPMFSTYTLCLLRKPSLLRRRHSYRKSSSFWIKSSFWAVCR